MNDIVTLISAALLVIGSFFALVASIGLLRLPDLYTRMHAASKAGTMGACLMLIALSIHATDVGTMSRALAGVVFFLLTAPVSSHLLAKAAYSVGYRLHSSSVMDEMKREDKTN
ncbi:monovalent cation/H(+) antiporter subunit G [uncultured Hoeflea sp.]|jgi:multicomponent Na+:H+ antiporter subunit G|uniref:monovalent cation/H(+) antiporter subunit G n=1 Tax=uncultured Hoeflea sp. TaxID=538666 RepID=UPI0030D87C41|tara:strand:+ start:891 stop:1232 length:342 start_codon:yes stop_codon:yes gene_type:complete